MIPVTMSDQFQPPESGFASGFGGGQAVRAIAPGRLNLIGEHTDYAGGLVLPVAIGRGTTVAAAASPTGSGTTLVSLAKGHEVSLAPGSGWPRRTAPAERWANYPLGTLALLREAGVPVPECRLEITSDLPLGGGLSSSASLMIATGVAALALAGVDLDWFGRMRLGRLAQRAETEWAGVPCGLMDPAISALGRAGHAMLLDCRDESFEFVPLPESLEIVVFDSGVRHRLADGGYAARRQAVEEAGRAVAEAGGGGLRELADRGGDEAWLGRLGLGETILRRARHVVREIVRVRRAAEAMKAMGAMGAGDAATLGRILLEGHASLRDDFAVSIDELDTLVDAAAEAGAFGARLTGGGFGGGAIALVARGEAERVAAGTVGRFARRFGREPGWFVTGAGPGAGMTGA
jgi:galactokinase